MIRLLAKFRRCEQGATMVEMAVVTGAALLLILGMLEFAVLYWSQHNLLLAVEHAGRWAMINNADTTVASDAASYVCNILNPGGASCTNLTAGGTCGPSAGHYCANATSTTNANGIKILTLTASYGFSFLNVTGGGLTLTGQTTVPLD
jgi:Flp pilus assembly protein TadG